MEAHAASGFDPFGVDPVTIFVAILASSFTLTVRYFRDVKPIATRRRVINDFLNGSVIYPFLLLIVSVASTRVFDYIKDAKLAIALAGTVGVIFVIGELVLACSHEEKKEE